MTPTQWFANGYHDLVSVIPPDGQLSPRSKIRPEARGKVPGIFNGTCWVGYPWRDHQPGPADFRQWETWGGNLGLRADLFPMVDIDVGDADLVVRLSTLFQRQLGPAPVRIGRPPHRGLIYGCQAGIRKLRIPILDAGHVEVLGLGQQYVIEGRHPCGTDYEWPDGKPGPSHELTWVRWQEITDAITVVKGWVANL